MDWIELNWIELNWCYYRGAHWLRGRPTRPIPTRPTLVPRGLLPTRPTHMSPKVQPGTTRPTDCQFRLLNWNVVSRLFSVTLFWHALGGGCGWCFGLWFHHFCWKSQLRQDMSCDFYTAKTLLLWIFCFVGIESRLETCICLLAPFPLMKVGLSMTDWRNLDKTTSE